MRATVEKPYVRLVDYTGKNSMDKLYAAKLLVFAKQTRLLDEESYDRVMNLPDDEVEDELVYIANTIPSSWEFVNCTFFIGGVSRACAQQITRTRTASFAMQSQRIQDVSGMGVYVPDEGMLLEYQAAADDAAEHYRALFTQHGAENARGVLPLNTRCNLVAQYNLRTLSDLVRKRSSGRVQEEYRCIVQQMRDAVLHVWPWAEWFFRSRHEAARALLEEEARAARNRGDMEAYTRIWKAIDMLEG